MQKSRREFLVSAAAGIACALGAKAMGADMQARPNVLFLLSDDQRPDAIGACGNKHVRTPNLDKLIGQGMRFERAYCNGANQGAVCVPSRAMILTGRNLFHQARQFRPESYPTTFARAMKSAGYVTLRTGKKGSTPAQLYGEFDREFTVERSETCCRTHADNAIEFMKEHAGKRPFFAYVEFATPHDPQPAPREYLEMYKADQLDLSDRFLPLHPFDNGEMTVRDEGTLPWPRTKESVLGKLARYYASTTWMDSQIGRILAALDETGQRDNTIIIFASDNGLSLGDHGLLGKQNLYEFGGMHVPLAICGPGIGTGASKAMVYLYDLFPTVCDLAGLPAPEKVDGLSLAPVLRGKNAKVRDQIVLAYRDVQRSIRDERWKLIRYPQINRMQLFDLENDPHELHDLAGKAEHADREKAMVALLAEKLKEAGDTCRLSSDHPGDGNWSPPRGGSAVQG